MKQNKTVHIVMLALAAAVLLGGCRASPVLEQVIYQVEAPEVDLENETKLNDNDEDHTLEDEDLSSKDQNEDSETERDFSHETPEQGDGEEEQPAPDTQYDPYAVDDQATDTAPEEQPEPVPEPSADPADGTAITEDPSLLPSTEVTLRQVVDGRGTAVDVPESVNTVTAVGEAAVIVQMLGGAGRLVASSADYTGNLLAAEVFADEGFVQTQTLWSGSGSSALGDEAFQTLLELHPDVCFTVSGQSTFTDAQLEQLAANQIYCVVLPKLNNPANIKSAVDVAAQVLGDKSAEGGTNAPALAAEWSSWYDSILAQVAGRVDRFTYNDIDFSYDKYAQRGESTLASETTDGFYTLYISHWDADATYQVYSDTYVTLSGTGAAVAPSGYSTSPLSYYMSEAGVINTAATYADQFRLRWWYVNPLRSSTRIIELAGPGGTYTEEHLTSVVRSGDTEGGQVYLGMEEFPAIVVASSAVKSAIEADAASNKLWTNYGPVSSADGKLHGYGFNDEIGQFVASDIRGPYEIYVNPAGVGSWTDGSAEGVLEAMWVAGQFYDAFTQEELSSAVTEFYSRFYRHALTAEQLEQILAGR